MSNFNFNQVELKIIKLILESVDTRNMFVSLEILNHFSKDVSSILSTIIKIPYFKNSAIDLDYVIDKSDSFNINGMVLSLLKEDIEKIDVDKSEFWSLVDQIKLTNIKANVIPILLSEYEKIVSSKSEFDILDPLSKIKESITSILGKNSFSNKTEDDLQNIRDRLSIYSGNNESDQKRFFTGYKTMDEILWGFGSSELSIFMGATGVGKTTLLLNLGYQLWHYGNANVVFFSLEMPTSQISRRLDSRILGIDYDILKKAEFELSEHENIVKSVEENEHLFKIVDIPPKTAVKKLEEYILSINNKPDVIIIDYLGLMGGYYKKNADRWEVLNEVALDLKYLAKRYKVHVMTASQVNSDAANRKNVQMEGFRTSDTAGSKSICDHADIGIGLHYDDNLGILSFSIPKARDMAKQSWQMFVDRQRQHIYEIDNK